jgi:hypothetical protein
MVGLLIAFSLAQLASAPFWGSFSDRYGRRTGTRRRGVFTGARRQARGIRKQQK